MKTGIFAFIFALLFVNIASAQDTYNVDVKKSLVRWEGKKVLSGHWGDVNIKSGKLMFDAGKLTGGEFDIDMNTIVALDLKENQGKSKLEGHLKSEDFFNVAKFPTATLKITKVEELKSKGKENYRITGDLTIKGITHSVSFPATVNLKNKKVDARAEFNIDRTKWDIKYNSGNFFKDLGDNVIKDEINFKVKLVTQ